MNPRWNTKRTILIILAFIIVIACTCNTAPFLKPPPLPPTAAPKTLHFENELVAFDYLGNLKAYAGGDSKFQYYPDINLGGEMVAGLGDPKLFGHDLYFRSIRIFRQPMPAGWTVETMMQDAYNKVEAVYPRHKAASDVSGPVTVAGLPAFQENYRIFSGEPAYDMRDMWALKGETLFIISIWTEYTNDDDLAAFQKSAEVFLQNLQIK